MNIFFFIRCTKKWKNEWYFRCSKILFFNSILNSDSKIIRKLIRFSFLILKRKSKKGKMEFFDFILNQKTNDTIGARIKRSFNIFTIFLVKKWILTQFSIFNFC